jgi:hypothetical protein
MAAFIPIYQGYVDAVRQNAEAKLAKQDLVIHQLQGQQQLIDIQNQIQERKIAAQVWGQQGTTPDTAGAGDDPSEQNAARMDKMAQALAPVNPKASLEWATKASTLRDQVATRKKDQLAAGAAQMKAVGDLFGAVKDQAGYTAALQTLASQGVDITKFQLSGQLDQDTPKLEQLAKGSQTYSEKLTAAHQNVTEDQAQANYLEKVRHDRTDEGLKGAQINLQGRSLALRDSVEKSNMDYKARSDARAAAGFQRSTDMDLAKAQAQAGRPTPADKAYVDSLIASDPVLSTLPDNQKKAAASEMVLSARSKLAKGVKKPGDLPSADDFMGAVDEVKQDISKRVTKGNEGTWFGIGKKDATLAPRNAGSTGTASKPANKPPLPPTANSPADLAKVGIGDSLIIKGKLYKKISATEVEPIE